MDAKDGLALEVSKTELSQTRVVADSIPSDLAAGQVLLKIDRFAFTSNNITYGLVGEAIGYWKFFPADDGWGRIPASAFADVVRSNHPDVHEGERVQGWFPMAHHLVIDAGAVTKRGIVDQAPHRADTAPVYRTYTKTAADAQYNAEYEDQHLLLYILFMTGFLVDDMIADNDFYGAEAFVIGSASSKTGIALAHQLHDHARGPVIGLTSPGNVEFVEGLPYYDKAVAYDDVESLENVPIVFIDHSGDGEVANRVHRHFGDNVSYSCMVGMTHVGAAPRDSGLPGAEPQFFFAPGQIEKRTAELGAEGLQQQIGDAWQRFRNTSGDWLTVKRSIGQDAVERVYQDVLAGKAKPDEGHILSMWE